MDIVKWSVYCCCLVLVASAPDETKDEIDRVIEDEITEKLSEDLIQSIEKKFLMDLEKSMDMGLLKIKLLLENGTTRIQERLSQLIEQLDAIRKTAGNEVEICLYDMRNETTALAEKALHQMVVCGYALIGHDPAQAVRTVITLKNIIKKGVEPIHQQKEDIYNLLKLCGHEHDSLKKVVKCVISKSPLIKSAMMDVTGKLINGVIDLTKLMAHGAMHEACLIEVVNAIEDEAFKLIGSVRNCTFGNNSVTDDIGNFIKQDNATILDVDKRKVKINTDNQEVKEMKELIRRMLSKKESQDFDKKFKKKLLKLQKDLTGGDTNDLISGVTNTD